MLEECRRLHGATSDFDMKTCAKVKGVSPLPGDSSVTKLVPAHT